MTVLELIEKLQALPGDELDRKVVIYTPDGSYFDLERIDVDNDDDVLELVTQDFE